MKLYPLTDSIILIDHLKKQFELCFDGATCAFIDWHRIGDNDKAKKQIIATTYLCKNVDAIIIFDRYRSLTEKDINWFNSISTTKRLYFYEPCLINRDGFKSMFFWYDFDSLKHYHYNKKNIDVGHVGATQIELFGIKSKECDSYQQVSSSIINCTTEDFRIGYLPDLTEMLLFGCVPLLPKRHRFYHSLFDDLVIKNHDDLTYKIKMSINLGREMLEDFIDNLMEWEEFDIKCTVQNIYNILK
jgi:hypothetical protein